MACCACPLGPGPHVAASGPVDAHIALVGEAPGYNEARTGEPFVGQSGKFLDKLIALAGWSRADLRITNLVACRPPDNRKPTAEERAACHERLLADIEGANVVVLLGALAIEEFLPNTKLKIYHGLPKERWINTPFPVEEGEGGVIRSVMFVPMYHPAVALYVPELRATLMNDWRQLPERLAQVRPQIIVDYGVAGVQLLTGLVAVDTEVNIGDGRVVSAQVSDGDGTASLYWDATRLNLCAAELVLGHNLKFDLKQFAKLGMDTSAWPIADTMLAAALVGEPQLGLKPLALKRLGVEMTTLGPLMQQATELLLIDYLEAAKTKLEPPSGKRKLWRLGGSAALAKSFREVEAASDKKAALARRHALRGAIGQPPEADVEDVAQLLPNEFLNYGCADADMTRRIWPGLLAEMRDKGVENLFWNVETPLVRVLVDVEAKGLAVDRVAAATLRDELTTKAIVLSMQLHDQIGLVNPLSPDAVGVALYDTLKLPVLGYTESGKPTTARWAMEILGEKEPIVHDILDYRKYRKLVGTYLDPWLASSGRIHADFNQVRQTSDEEAWGATATGRLSCVPLDAEIQTASGWKHHDQLAPGEIVVGYNLVTKRLEWTKLLGVTHGHGAIGKIRWKRGGEGIECTPEHKWVVAHRGLHTLVEAQYIGRDKGHYQVTGEADVWCPRTELGTWMVRQKEQVAITGNSSGPNFQNIPSRDPLGRAVRSCIVAEEGFTLLSLDDKQIELLLMAIDANDEEWLDLFRRGEDLHMATARSVFGPSPTDDQRKAAKNINFAWGYGVRAGRLGKMLALSGVPHSREDAQSYLDKFEAAHPRLRQRWHEVVDEARRLGYATTFWGRRRYLPALQVAETDEEFYEAAKQAYNHHVQGTAADLSKVAAKVVADLCPNQLVALIHDERLLEVPQAKLTKLWVESIIEAVLAKTRPLIPHGDLMRIEAKAGTRWGDLKEVS